MKLAQLQSWLDGPQAKRLGRILTVGLSLLILWLLVSSISEIGWRRLLASLPANPLYWLLFAGFYLALPVADWAIYRHWWKLGWRQISQFLKMRVMNEALFSYSGQAFLLLWATKHLGIEYDPAKPRPPILGRGDGPGLDPAKNPFAAIKDMAITSGLAGNFATLLMLVVALMLGGGDVLGSTLDRSTLRLLMICFGAMLLLNIGIVAFRGKVMSLRPRDNYFALAVHFARVAGGQLLLMLSWSVALPGIGFGAWFLLGALRMVIGRMPLPNKELLFAALAVRLTGAQSVEVAALMATQGGLYLVAHGLAWAGALAIDRSQPAR